MPTPSKTTLLGVIILALTLFQIYRKPELGSDPTVMAQLATATGLICAQDDKRKPAQ